MMMAAAVASPPKLASHGGVALPAGLGLSASVPALWDEVLELTKGAAEKGMDAVAWGSQLASALHAAGVSLPSPGLAHALVSYVCWSGHHVPAAWKYIEWALASGLAPPVLVLAHLSIRSANCTLSRTHEYRHGASCLRFK